MAVVINADRGFREGYDLCAIGNGGAVQCFREEHDLCAIDNSGVVQERRT